MATKPVLRLVPPPAPVPEQDKPDKPKRAAGSYRKRGKDSYELRYRGNSKSVIAANDTQAERALAAFITQVDKGKFVPAAKMSVKQLSDRFLRDNPSLSEHTKINYKIHLDDRILPVFGDLKIDKVKPVHVYDFLANLAEDGIRKDDRPGGLGPATIQKIFHVLSSMFSFATDMGELEDNPCAKVKPPKIPKRKKLSIDLDPAREMLKALKDEPLKYKCIVLVAAATGAGRGEVLGLSDSTLDLDLCTITIDRASRHSKDGKITFGSPKTEGSVRVSPFPPALVPLFKEMIAARDDQREKCGDKWISEIEVYGEIVANDLLFTQWNGKPLHPNSVDSWFAKFKQKHDLPAGLTFHGLRHTNITQLLRSGVDVGTIADNAGHARKSTTLAYVDLDAGTLSEVAIKINHALDLENIVPDLLGQPVNPQRKKKE